MAKYIMAFFQTDNYKAPTPSKVFWLCHYFGWGSLTLIISLLNLIVLNDVYFGVLVFILIFASHTIACFDLRKKIHKNNLLSLSLNKIWLRLAFYSVLLSLLTTLVILPPSILYLSLKGVTAGPTLYFLTFLNNWFTFGLFIFIWSLIYVSVKYSNQLKEAQKSSAELALELKNAQLNTLMSQLNPHFLFNALNNIRGLILEDSDKSRDMLTRLAEMLRYSLLSDKQEFETLENELSVVHAYLKLASIQYEERLQYTEEIDTALLSSNIPPMLIQMLIENAVKYGIDQTEAGGEIKLSILRLDNKMIVNVSNPGDLSRENFESTGLGVKNIKKRLNLLYGDEASFSIRQEHKNVIVTVVLPSETLVLEGANKSKPALNHESSNQTTLVDTKPAYSNEPLIQ